MATRSATKAKPKSASKTSVGKTKATKTTAKASPPKMKVVKSAAPPAKIKKVPAPDHSHVEKPAVKAPAEPAKAAPAVMAIKGDLKRRELLEEVSRRADLPKHKVKPVLDSLMEVMGEAIAEGRPMNLQPLGKVVRKRHTEKPGANISIVRIRQNRPTD